MSLIEANTLYHELDFTASRSGGPGGQNVNKVNSKITLKFDVVHSEILSDDQKTIILARLHQHLTKDGVLMLSSQEKRSQLENKQEVMRKFGMLLTKAFTKRKPRKATKPSKASVEKRIGSKKLLAEKKKLRRGEWE
jgi:ribosome-associated protein